jgi:signal transduction histidine kinase
MIVKNMIHNAINALSTMNDARQRRIQIRLKHETDAHIVLVQDNGPGIPADVQEKLFAKFATDTTGGMGVGLYVCQLLLKSHGGEITFETIEGKGTTFSARFGEQELSDAK